MKKPSPFQKRMLVLDHYSGCICNSASFSSSNDVYLLMSDGCPSLNHFTIDQGNRKHCLYIVK